jgi:GNAT superfamily N-acetyltransferase
MIHPFFISDTPFKVHTEGWEIRWFEKEEIEAFRGDGRFTSAFTFDPGAPDVIGAAAVKDGRILGMAGASADSPSMWQIGINVEEEARGLGIGRMLTGLLRNEILERGKLPYYGTAMSHIGSLKVAVGAGFVPAWSELVTSKIDG